MNPPQKYKCPVCQWQGTENELEYDDVGTCFGDDKVEICPKCGSMEVCRISEEIRKDNLQ